MHPQSLLLGEYSENTYSALVKRNGNKYTHTLFIKAPWQNVIFYVSINLSIFV